MDIAKQEQRKVNRDLGIAMIVPVAIIGKLIAFFLLPEKYFYDSGRMAGMLYNNGHMGQWSGYRSTVDIFRKINYLNLTSREQWSIALGVVGTIIIIIMVSRVKEMSLTEVFFTLMSTGLLNIYAFNIAKEPVQMTFFLFVLIIIVLPFDNNIIKIIGCALIFFWESNTYRSYYILMAIMCIMFFVIFNIFRKVFEEITKLKIILAAIMCMIGVFALIFASQFVDKESYDEVMSAKTEHTNEGAVTAITNWVGDENDTSNYGSFMINYAINGIRMMFPVELIIKSPGYFPFVIYQVFILAYWVRAIKKIQTISNQGFLALICFSAYIFGSFTFEPDFGSWVRHEAASFPVFYLLAYEDLCMDKGEENELDTPMEIKYETKSV